MPKNISKVNGKISDIVDVSSQYYLVKGDNQLKINRILKKRRSQNYINTLKQLDSDGYVQNQKNIGDIVNQINNEFQEIQLQGILIGIISLCYLGAPYEVHSLDYALNIIAHYKNNEAMPNGLDRARNLALRGGYEFIEVYEDCCRAISSDGSVSVIKS